MLRKISIKGMKDKNLHEGVLIPSCLAAITSRVLQLRAVTQAYHIMQGYYLGLQAREGRPAHSLEKKHTNTFSPHPERIMRPRNFRSMHQVYVWTSSKIKSTNDKLGLRTKRVMTYPDPIMPSWTQLQGCCIMQSTWLRNHSYHNMQGYYLGLQAREGLTSWSCNERNYSYAQLQGCYRDTKLEIKVKNEKFK